MSVCPPQFQSLLKPDSDEYYINQFEHEGEIVVVTNTTLNICDTSNKLKWNKPWLDFYSVESTGDLQLKLFYMAPKAGSKAPLIEKVFSFPVQTKRDLWVIVFRKLLREAWQEYYELNWIKGNEIYQLFRSCLHYSTKGKRVQIIVALSTTKFYCFNPVIKNSLIPKEISGSCQISEISSITTYSNSNSLIKLVGPSTILNGRGKVPISFMLRFFSPEDATWFTNELSRLYFILSKKPLETVVSKLNRLDSVKEGIKEAYLEG